MARPTHRLDIHYVPEALDASALDAVRALHESWRSRGWLVPDGPLGGYRRVRIDDPGEIVLYANSVGGFRVRCPDCGASVAHVFGRLQPTTCASCGATHTTDQLVAEPPIAAGRASLVLVDVESADVPAEPGFRRVWRRL